MTGHAEEHAGTHTGGPDGPVVVSQRYVDALVWAAQLHGRQVRKSTGEPYLAHLLAVSSLVWSHGGDEDQAIAGLLHDAVEDAGGAPVLAEIRARFGERVARIVDACSDSDVRGRRRFVRAFGC